MSEKSPGKYPPLPPYQSDKMVGSREMKFIFDMQYCSPHYPPYKIFRYNREDDTRAT